MISEGQLNILFPNGEETGEDFFENAPHHCSLKVDNNINVDLPYFRYERLNPVDSWDMDVPGWLLTNDRMEPHMI